MAQPTLLTDDLLRHLMAVGQVDIVVGVPALNNAGTIGPALRAADEGLAKFFPRDRTVIIAADGGSRDGTPEIVQQLASRAAGYGGLRTRHQIAASYRGGPGKAGAFQIIFAAADLLQARAVALLDPEVTSLTPAWVAALTGPAAQQQFDFVAPLYDRHPLEGPLLTQLVRPLIRATFRRRVDEPLIGEFGCSGRFATHCLAQDIWESGHGRDGIELWLIGTALGGAFQTCQTYVGPRTLAPGPRPSLRDLFPLVVGSLFDCLSSCASQWLPRETTEPLPTIGAEARGTGQAPSLDPARLGASLCQDIRDLRPVLASILAADTFAGLWALAESGNPETCRYSTDLWIATVYDFLTAHHAGVMDRAHIAQALMPLYLGRVASFLTQHAAAAPAEAEGDLERISQEFELARPYLTAHWNRTR